MDSPKAQQKGEIPKLFVARDAEARVREGLRLLQKRHVRKLKGAPNAGDIAWVVDENGKFIAQCFCNPSAEPIAQVISLKEKEAIDAAFFSRKVIAADSFRRAVLGFSGSYRLFYGEADGIPGLVVDRFCGICSMQVSCPGVERFKDAIAAALLGIDGIVTVVERNDSRSRERLGLPLKKGVLAGKSKTQAVIEEGAVKFEVDVLRGHKTGFYLDQSENRVAAAKYCRAGSEMLDVFSYTGGFGLHAAAAGANVLMLDMKDAIAQARRNVKLNGLESRVSFLEGKAFEETKKMLSRPKRFDVVSVDPPAFAQRPADLKRAARAYHQINYNCMKLLKDDGILITSSCSSYVSPEGFLKILSDAANHAGKEVSVIEQRSASRDHPVPAHSGSAGSYLKCVFLRVRSK
ncbi:MAG: class I SAM-dependent rRNA methyltransferase [Candidatus Diapherotrites archaeon]|uniref:Class I SAM-dependent rRNA methyltransferase n=1 Tax=Candidatus Iainarchaeum sp. TaxID=3101447 RepID=A0A8T3YM94_9ARCH|nr:class I SAM-dependent rRNA methyltransferase [Candidatus Diapherotrites archaeon]